MTALRHAFGRFAVLLGFAVAVLAIAVACTDDGGDQPGASNAPDCPPVTPVATREEGAQTLLDLVEDQREYVQANLPDHELGGVSIQGPSREISFLYTDAEGSGVYVTQDDGRPQWQAGQETPDEIDLRPAPLDITGLQRGPESIAQEFEASVPGVKVANIVLMQEDCDLRWQVAGFIEDATGRDAEIAEGVIRDATGEFQLTDRRDFP